MCRAEVEKFFIFLFYFISSFPGVGQSSLLQSVQRIWFRSGKKPDPTSDTEQREHLKQGWCHCRSSKDTYFPSPNPAKHTHTEREPQMQECLTRGEENNVITGLETSQKRQTPSGDNVSGWQRPQRPGASSALLHSCGGAKKASSSRHLSPQHVNFLNVSIKFLCQREFRLSKLLHLALIHPFPRHASDLICVTKQSHTPVIPTLTPRVSLEPPLSLMFLDCGRRKPTPGFNYHLDSLKF